MFEERYEYNGYTIVETVDGVWVGDMEFVSYDEAVEWIDSRTEESPSPENSVQNSLSLHTYRVFFTPPKGYTQNSVIVPDCIDEEDAISWVENEYCPNSTVIDIQLWD